MNAQGTQPPPAVDWRMSSWVDEALPFGALHQFTGINTTDCTPQFTTTSPPPAGEIEREDSGEDWYYSHCNVFVGGVLTYIAAVGYSSPLNWTPGNDPAGCYSFDISDWPDTKELQLIDRRRVQPVQTMGLFDLEGHMIWCKALMPGTFYNVAQGLDGNLVAIGEVYTNNQGTGGLPFKDLMETGGSTDLSAVNCGTAGLGQFKKKMSITKVDLSGNVIWRNCYGAPGSLADIWSKVANGFGIEAITIGTGTGYYAVGQTQEVQGVGGGMFALRINENGSIADYHFYRADNAPFDAFGLNPDNYQIRPLSVRRLVEGTAQRLVISGMFTTNLPFPERYEAFLLYLEDINQDPYGLLQLRTTEDANLSSIFAIDPIDGAQLKDHSTDALFAQDGNGGYKIVWPVIANIPADAGTFAGKWKGYLETLAFTLPDLDLDWVSHLGEVQAYDLQAGIVQTSDGSLAIVSTKGPDGHSFANPLMFNDLSGDVQNCLSTVYSVDLDQSCATDPYTAFDWDAAGQDIYGSYWNTNCFVAKLAIQDGHTIWQTTFDADDQEPSCYPGDIRDQECMYRITELADGSLVVSGNSSHNLDDSYLAKLLPECQGLVEYDFAIAEAVLGSDDHSYTLSTDESWSSDKNALGIINIPSGLTLTISNCTIRFADSEQLAWPTRIVVHPGGKLILEHATLTSLDACPNSLWDGVQVLGDYFAQQTQPNQGYVSMKNSTIENARAGLLTSNAAFNDPLGPIVKESTGGIVQAQDCTFRNNIYDVVFRPFENRLSNGTVISNVSSFTRSTFLTDGGVPAEGIYPADHVALSGVRGIPFKGCAWSNTLFGPPLEIAVQQGTGIHSMNSSFIVGDDCSAIVNYGEPCPPGSLTSSSFTNLHRGIVATTFDPSRTFSVANATFTACDGGIRMEGIQDAAITGNSFDVAEPFVPGLLGPTYGIYSDQCTGYSIQENSFLTTQPNGVKKVGLIIKDSGPYYNTFYNNTFQNLFAGSIIQGLNAEPKDLVGLEIKCNDYGLEQMNAYDVALTGTAVRVQRSQGSAIVVANDPDQLKNPAGNRFSLGHAPNPPDPEADWHVENLATVVDYFHHSPTASDRTKPTYSNMPAEIIGNGQNVFWPGKETACPSKLQGGGPVVKRIAAEQQDAEYADSKDAYDATKDNGDTYSLLGYVSDPGHSSTQVRNALQSVAPKVGAEVWQAAFEREPAMSAWHITQALLSNSPVQGEVLKMVELYALPEAYANLVYNAQNGEVNILSLLQSAMALHAGAKSEAMTDLGTMTWLDSLQLDTYLDSLLLLHNALPNWNSSLTVSGILAAKGEFDALAYLAENEALSGSCPALYELLKRYAEAEQATGWADADAVDVNWLEQLAAQRDVQGSAQANAWLHALGEVLPQEIILLPGDEAKSLRQRPSERAVAWQQDLHLDVFPNPSHGQAFAAYELPEGMEQAELRVVDVYGKVLRSARLGSGAGLASLNNDALTTGVYLIDLRLDGHSLAQAKLIVQR